MSIIPNYVPPQYKTVNLMLAVKDAPKAIAFYNRAFGAEEVLRLTDPAGVVVHAEVKIADTIIMLAEENPEYNSSPASLGGTSVIVQLYTADVEGFIAEALKAGAELLRPIQKQFYGDRCGRIRDPFGHHWIISTRVENMTNHELINRFHALYS